MERAGAMDGAVIAAVKLRILFFGKVADVVGRELDVALPEGGCTIGELRKVVAATAGSDILLKPGVRVSIDKKVVRDDARVEPGAEVAFFSVFSGG